MTHLVVDASVAVKWFLDEMGSRQAREIYAAGNTLIAPSFIRMEVQHALLYAARGGKLARESAIEAVGELPRLLDVVAPMEDHVEAALALSWRLDHPVYDCLYIVLAMSAGATLVTADERQFAAARKSGAQARRL